jgi:hypothetical protein
MCIWRVRVTGKTLYRGHDSQALLLPFTATTTTVSSSCLFPTLLLLSFATGLQLAFTRLSWIKLVMWLMKRRKGKRASCQQQLRGPLQHKLMSGKCFDLEFDELSFGGSLLG